MTRRLQNLRPICGALMAADFEPSDRLKAILQVAYEVLGASSIVAYKYDRVSQQLEIFAMPGVVQREMMRGPTPEPIFIWEEVEPGIPPAGVWLENKAEYRQYEEQLQRRFRRPGKTSTDDDFRSRELQKYDGKGDIALAKICLYKGVGQTHDRVGQLFFNFHKSAPKGSSRNKVNYSLPGRIV